MMGLGKDLQNTADPASQLFDQDSFYDTFLRDLRRARTEVIIESPFITVSRTRRVLPMLKEITRRGVLITVNTRCPDEHAEPHRTAAYEMIGELQSMGVNVLYTGGHHRKLAFIDDEILWEGSLNILSHYNSCEIMRRIKSRNDVEQMKNYIGINKFLK